MDIAYSTSSTPDATPHLVTATITHADGTVATREITTNAAVYYLGLPFEPGTNVTKVVVEATP